MGVETVVITEDDRADAASFAPAADGTALLEREARGEGHSFLEAVRRFTESHLPCRGWYRVLEVGAGAGSRAMLLAERGYEVTVVESDELALRFVRHRFERRGLHAGFQRLDRLAEIEGRFDAVFCFDPPVSSASPTTALKELRRLVRPRGLLFGGPGFADVPPKELRRAALKVDENGVSEFQVFRAGGKLQKLVSLFSRL